MIATGAYCIGHSGSTSLLVVLLTHTYIVAGDVCRSDSERQPLNTMAEKAAQEKQWAKEDTEFSKFACSLKLCVAFAANVGGVGTLIGCGPNIVLKGMVDK